MKLNLTPKEARILDRIRWAYRCGTRGSAVRALILAADPDAPAPLQAPEPPPDAPPPDLITPFLDEWEALCAAGGTRSLTSAAALSASPGTDTAFARILTDLGYWQAVKSTARLGAALRFLVRRKAPDGRFLVRECDRTGISLWRVVHAA